MKKKIRETAEEILQEYTSCYSEVDEDCLVNMLNRLASDVAREIFAEIDKEYGENCGAYRIDDLTYGQLWDYLAELKKKYESEDTE